MAIIIRETMKLPNGQETVVKRYISDFSPLTGDLREKADGYDLLIQSKVKEIEDELQSLGLFELRGRPKVLKLWYEYGTRLSFIEDMELSPLARKHIWQAIYDHSTKLYDHSEEMSTRLQRAPTTSNLCYSYLIGKLDWDFVDAAGNWTAWVEFLDSEVMRTDARIIEWIKEIQVKGPLQSGFLRELNKAIRNRLKGIETRQLLSSNLLEILDEILEFSLGNRNA